MNDEAPAVFPAETVDAEKRMQEKRPRFSICSVVNRPAQYREMVASFQAGGFTAAAGCEYLYLDNATENRHESFAGYNLLLRAAQGDYVILCHQDVTLLEHGIARMNEVIAELDALDPDWGLFGNAGGYWPNRFAMWLQDRDGAALTVGAPLPRRCYSLDENFIVVRADANLALSRDLNGYHLYGAELCIVGAQLGHQAYIVDFFLRHWGEGRMDATFYIIRQAMLEKYGQVPVLRIMKTMCTEMIFTPWRVLTRLANTYWGLKISRRLIRRFGSEPRVRPKIRF
jgi:hypothetical protein